MEECLERTKIQYFVAGLQRTSWSPQRTMSRSWYGCTWLTVLFKNNTGISIMWCIYVHIHIHICTLNIYIIWLIFRTVPLDRHEDEGQPSVLGGDDPDDHLFMISLILMVTMVLNIKMIMTTIYSRSAWSWWSSWSSTSRPDPSEIFQTSDSSEKSSPRPDQDEIFAILKVMTTRWSSRYTWWSRYSEIPTRVGSSKNIYSELSVAVHSVQTRLV